MLIDKKKNVQSRLSKLTFSVFIFFQNLVVRLCRLKQKKNLPGNDQFDCYFLFQTVRVLGLLRGWGLVIMTFEWSFMSFQWVTLYSSSDEESNNCLYVSFFPKLWYWDLNSQKLLLEFYFAGQHYDIFPTEAPLPCKEFCIQPCGGGLNRLYPGLCLQYYAFLCGSLNNNEKGKYKNMYL